LDALKGKMRCALPVLAIFLIIIAFDIIFARCIEARKKKQFLSEVMAPVCATS
jgi:hypothetical protein